MPERHRQHHTWRSAAGRRAAAPLGWWEDSAFHLHSPGAQRCLVKVINCPLLWLCLLFGSCWWWGHKCIWLPLKFPKVKIFSTLSGSSWHDCSSEWVALSSRRLALMKLRHSTVTLYGCKRMGHTPGNAPLRYYWLDNIRGTKDPQLGPEEMERQKIAEKRGRNKGVEEEVGKGLWQEQEAEKPGQLEERRGGAAKGRRENWEA